MIESTLVIIKPDAMARGLAGEVMSRLERKGLRTVGCKLERLSEEVLRAHYAHLAEQSFFPRILAFMRSTPVLLQVWRGVEAVRVVRTLAGPTNGRLAPAGTIRGDLSQSIQCNVLHASDTPEAATAEIERFFASGELLEWDPPHTATLYSADEA